MPDPFRELRPGDPFPTDAAVVNAMLGAAKAYRESTGGGAAEASPQFRQGDLVRVANNTGANLDRRAVVGLLGPVFTPAADLDAFLREVAFNAGVPGSAAAGKFGVMLGPVPTGGVGRAFVAGVVQVRVNVTDATHTLAEAESGSTARLKSDVKGTALMLWREGGIGEQWAIIRFGAGCAGP